MATAHMNIGIGTAKVAAPARKRDPFGFIAGWRAFTAFNDLNALSDGELKARGLTRADLPRVALAAMRAEA